MTSIDLDQIERDRRRIIDTHLTRRGAGSSARGIHHIAMLSSDVERTVKFYQDVLEFPLLEVFENRDYAGSTHFFFDFPGLDLGPYAEVLGGLHHLAISVDPETWKHLRSNLDHAGVDYVLESEVSVYFTDPDGVRVELLADPLGEMYGTKIIP